MRRNPNSRLTLLRDERGSALVAVVGLVAVLALITVGVTATTVHSMGFTSATRAGVQSAAAADSGINYARAQLAAGALTTTCHPTFTAPTGSGVQFAVTVSYSGQDTGGSFTPGCPGATLAKRLMLTSVGTADAKGVAGQSSDDTRKVEAVLNVVTPTTAVPGSGAAIYAFSASGFTASGQLVSVDGSSATVHIKSGDVACTGASGVPDSFVVENGSITISNSCNVTGSLWAKNLIKITGNVTVGGSVHGANLTMTGSSKVLGTGWVTGTADFAWSTSVQGRVTAKTIVSPNPSGNTPGGRNIIPAGPAAETMPAVADWIDFNYNIADWPGFTERVLTTCTPAGVQAAIDALAAGPGVINALGCPSGIAVPGNTDIHLKNDVAIIANKFNFSSDAEVRSTVDRKFWLITPDTNPNGLPTCPTGGFLTIQNDVKMQSTVHVMAYTPCTASILNSVRFYGQVFSGQATINGAATMNFMAVGLPGYDLSTGTVIIGPAPAGATLGDVISIRDAGA